MERRTRVRFAPSPTGPLHMGGVRTALYNYLYAKRNGGDFILRIEDTDSHRFVPGAEKYIIDSLKWCGIYPDEGVDENGNVVEVPSAKHPHAPYRQSQRKGIYRKYAEELVEKGYAYYAFDSSESLEKARSDAEAKGQTFIYNQVTRMQMRNSLTLPEDDVRKLLDETTDWTVRFKMPSDTIVKMDDLIRGHIEVNTDTLDDKVLWKRADELPTYHLANIVDDHLMEITEVIRGEEWLPSLPLHYMLYKAFGWEEAMPRFAHLSLLLKPDGKGKLSKRDGDKMGFPVFPLKWVNSEGEVYRGYREDGYFPEAFVNMLAFLGWNPGTDQEIFSLDELVQAFSLDRIVKSGARFNPEKAHWYNREYLRMKSDEALTELLTPILEEHDVNIVDCPKCALTAGAEFNSFGGDLEKHIFTKEYVKSVISFTKERATFVKDFWTVASYLFVAPEDFAKFGVKAGAAIIQGPADPRAKVYDDAATAPFLAKDVDKFWKPEVAEQVSKVADFVKEYAGDWNVEAFEAALEAFIKGNEWPMGKVMNATRLALAGSASGLGIADIIARIGRKDTLSRIAYSRRRLG
ncbi:MAG: glutamate--tRNA ligase [Bacteroidales bacterium]|nr:glutamate--tRNA ligase [Bacteroidales bacterium]MDY6001861.1 glutamate--tRNA ligase [Candidatus Cryptobacteroides sp.]